MEPQTCTKCGVLPEDILMLACSHDLCLNCAAERLSHESKRKPATGIVCEFCNEKTQLDTESVYELQKIMLSLEAKKYSKQSTPSQRNPTLAALDDPRKSSAAPASSASALLDKYERPARTEKRDYQIDLPSKTSPSYSQMTPGAKTIVSPSSTATKRNCPEHPEEELLYYCFDCNCECICPECVIHGKHKNHEVKTLKKSQPVIKGRLESLLEGIEINVEGLTNRKQELERAIKELTEENNNTKRLVQKGFAELRQRINLKEKQVLGKCDKALELTIEAYDKGIKGIARKMDEIRQSSASIAESLRREELVLLNFYAKKHTDLQELVKKIDLEGFLEPNADRVLGAEPTLKAIGEVTSLLTQLEIDSSIKYEVRDEGRSLQYGEEVGGYDRYSKAQQQESRVPRDYSRKYG